MAKKTSRSIEKWNALKPSYRKDLERYGITRERYISGEPLTAARRHAHTPEHPERAERNPVRYQQYIQKHTVTPQLEQHVREIFVQALMAGLIERVDLSTVVRNIRKLSVAKQKQLLTFTFQEWQAKAYEDGEIDTYWTVDEGFDRINVFYYH